MPEPDLWPTDVPLAERGGPHFAELIAQLRRAQDAVAGVGTLPDQVAVHAAAALATVADSLAPYDAAPYEGIAGIRLDLPGRGHPFLLPFISDEWSDDRVKGRVTFTRLYDSGAGASHGGAPPLLFVEVLGRLSNTNRPIARTAYVTTNFRQVLPIGRELQLDATVDRIEGRKRFVSGRLYDGDVLVADAEALFVIPRPPAD
jgi:hypothetical protein